MPRAASRRRSAGSRASVDGGLKVATERTRRIRARKPCRTAPRRPDPGSALLAGRVRRDRLVGGPAQSARRHPTGSDGGRPQLRRRRAASARGRGDLRPIPVGRPLWLGRRGIGAGFCISADGSLAVRTPRATGHGGAAGRLWSRVGAFRAADISIGGPVGARAEMGGGAGGGRGLLRSGHQRSRVGQRESDPGGCAAGILAVARLRRRPCRAGRRYQDFPRGRPDLDAPQGPLAGLAGGPGGRNHRRGHHRRGHPRMARLHHHVRARANVVGLLPLVAG